MSRVTTLRYKGYEFDYNFYGQNEYTLQYCGDDIWFESLREVHEFIDEIEKGENG